MRFCKVSMRFLSIILAAAMTVPLLLASYTSFAVENGLPDNTGDDHFLFSRGGSQTLEASGKTVIEQYDGEDFGSSDDSLEIKYVNYHGKPAMTVTNENKTIIPITVSKRYVTPLDLSSLNELYFQIRTGGSSDVSYSFHVTLVSGDEYYSVGGSFEAGKAYDVYCPITSFNGKASVDTISFTAESSSALDSLTVSSIFGDDRFTYSHLKRFSSDSFESESIVEITENALILGTENSEHYIEAVIDSPDEKAESVISRVVISGAESGTLTYSVRNRDSEEYSDISAVTVLPGTNPYTFMYPASKGTYSYRLSFSGISAAQGEEFSVDSVSLSYFEEGLGESTEVFPITVSSCTLSSDGGKVSVSCSAQSSWVVDNMDRKLGLYAVDMWDKNEPILADTAEMSTLFEMSAGAGELGVNPGFCRFYVVLLPEGENDDTETVSAAVYPSVSGAPQSFGDSVLGVSSNDTSLAISVNASHVVTDVCIDDLFADDAGHGRVHSYAGEYYYFDNSYIKKLDSSLGFYLSAGVNVYVRTVFSPQNRERSVYSLPDGADYAQSMRFAAALDFLGKRYNGISGVILGKRIDSSIYNSIDKGSFIGYAQNYSSILRIASVVIGSTVPSAALIVPCGDGYIYSSDISVETAAPFDEITGIGTHSCDPMLISEVVSRFIFSKGGFPWYLMYECESDPASKAEEVTRYCNRLIRAGETSPSGAMLYWEPEYLLDGSDIFSLSSALAEGSGKIGVKTVTVSFGKQSEELTEDVFEALKNSSFEPESKRIIRKYRAEVLLENTNEGSVSVLDFRNSYGTGNFAAGGAFTVLTTEANETMSAFDGAVGERAVRAVGDPAVGKTGVMKCVFDQPKMIKEASYIDSAVCVGGESGKEYTVKAVLGSGASKYEYYADVKSGVPAVIRCRVEPISDESIDYIAFEVVSDDSITFDVSRVSAVSSDGNTEGLEKALGDENETENDENKDLIVTVIISLAVVTLVVFALLSVRNDKSEKNTEFSLFFQYNKKRKNVLQIYKR